MSYSNGPTIVTDGLVLALDAGDRNSYPGSGTTWSDLAGSNNGTLTNGPTFDSGNGGSIVFDKVNDYVNLGNILNYTSQNFSFCGWVSFLNFTSNRPPGDGNINTLPLIYKGSFQVNGYYITVRTPAGEIAPNTLALITSQSGARQVTTGTFPSEMVLNQWYYLACTREGSVGKAYINGQDQTTSSESHIDPSSSNQNFTISNYSNRFLLSNAKHALWTSYNRALSADEILQNYNATKGRFGL